MNDHHGSAAHTVPALRRGAHAFLRRYAAEAWQHQVGQERWEIAVPPEVQALPEPKRWRAHARQEAQRVADAHLYTICPELTSKAVALGAAIREGSHDEAAMMAGQPDVIASLGIEPPTPEGFLQWQDPAGVGYGGRGAPLIACHWGRLAKQPGHWLVWWSDNYVMAKGYKADVHATDRGAWSTQMSVDYLAIFGPLFYDYQQLIRPLPACSPAIPPAGEQATSSDGLDASSAALIYTTLATWELLTTPGGAHLTQHPAPADQAAADRAAGIRPKAITLASA